MSEYPHATDPGAFAETLLGQPLWPHQLDMARSKARYKIICSGRQSGKSRALAVIALHEASTRANILVLLVSAGETASRRLLDECAALATNSPLLRGSVLDENRSQLTLSNGSRIISVPASEKQIRGLAIDVLVLDEAGFISQDIWRSAEPAIIARPGSRVILCSSPWGGPDHFFRQLWHRGMTNPDEQVQSWHWPSSASPLVDAVLLDQIRERETSDYFAREYLAQWTDDHGSYFTEVELMDAVGDFDLVEPGPDGLALGGVVGGVDWGYSRDANTLAVIAARPDLDEVGRVRYWVPYLVERFSTPYAAWIDEVVQTATGYAFAVLVAEMNGVGAMPSQMLEAAMLSAGCGYVVHPVYTDLRLKETAFGFLKILMQQGRIGLPNHPGLLKQLRNLQFEALPSGGVRISVPERAGHDDLAMALALGVTAIYGNDLAPAPPTTVVEMTEFDDDFALADARGWNIAPY